MNATTYEWDVETLDEWADVREHDHSDAFLAVAFYVVVGGWLCSDETRGRVCCGIPGDKQR